MGRNDPLMRVGGVKGMATSLRKLGDKELSEEMRAASLAAAEKLVPYAKAKVPVGTGALRASIVPKATRRYARIVAGSTAATGKYARHVHSGYQRGRQKVRGVPYLKDAIPLAFGEIKKEYFKAMNKVAKRFEKKHGVSRVYGRYSK